PGHLAARLGCSETKIVTWDDLAFKLSTLGGREDRPEVTLPPQKRLGIALGTGYEVGESSSAAAARPAGGLKAEYGFVTTIDREIRHDPEREVGYGITDLWDEIVKTLQEALVSTDIELGGYIDHDGRITILPLTTAEEHIAIQRESKARTTLLQSIPDDHVADLHYMGPSHSAFVSATSTSKKMSYGDSPNHSSTTTYYVPSNSKTGSHRSGNVIEDVLQSFVADTEPEQQLAYEDLEQIENLVAPILSNKEPEYSPSMGYEHSNTTSKTESDEIIKSGVEELVPILCENEVTSKDKKEYDDDISSDEESFEDIEYVEASFSDPEIVSVEEENVVHQEEEVNLEDVFQIQDIVLREKLLSINRLIANIEYLNDNPTPDCVPNSSVSFPISEETDNSLSDNFSPEFETFCDHTEETRSGSTTTHADDFLPEYYSFCFEIEPDQERLINAMKNDNSDDSSSDPLLEEADLFLAFDNSIPPGIEIFGDESVGDNRFLEELLIDDPIAFPNNELPESDFDNPAFPRPPPEPPDAEFKPDFEEEIPVVINDKDEFDDHYSSFMFVIYSKVFSFLLSAESEDTIFDPGISV
nr:hypothetical protein [Tanacetum cinerariifolium]